MFVAAWSAVLCGEAGDSADVTDCYCERSEYDGCSSVCCCCWVLEEAAVTASVWAWVWSVDLGCASEAVLVAAYGESDLHVVVDVSSVDYVIRACGRVDPVGRCCECLVEHFFVRRG